MDCEESLKSKMRRLGYTLVEPFRPRNLILAGILGYLFITNGSRMGCFDSRRSDEAERMYGGREGNLIKTVFSVEETIDQGYNSSTWINPVVTREVEFNDGTTTTLSYHTHVWQPMRSWINGEEFDPQPGENYEVHPFGNGRNIIVRKVEGD